MEQGAWQADRAAPLNITMVAEITGPLPDARLRQALNAVQARHPHLRSRILVEHGIPTFVPCEHPLPLRMAAAPDTGWIEELEREINTPLDAESGPLLRCVRFRGGGTTTLLLTLHHSIGDGMSGVYLTRDLLLAASSEEPIVFPRLAPVAPIEDRLLGPSPNLKASFVLLRELWNIFAHRRPVRLRVDRKVAVWDRRTRVVHVHFEAPFADKLTERARAERTTIHAALSAAMILAVLADASAKRATGVVFGSAVNLRKYLSPAVDDDIGFFASMLPFRAAVHPEAPFWELARIVRKSLADYVGWGVLGIALRFTPLIQFAFGGIRAAPRALAARWADKVPTTSGLTNLGRLPLPTVFGPVRLEALHFAVSPSAFGEFLATATGLHGRIHWNFMWPDPSLDTAHAQALIQDCVARLHRAVD
jgi:hypothetical protein